MPTPTLKAMTAATLEQAFRDRERDARMRALATQCASMAVQDVLSYLDEQEVETNRRAIYDAASLAAQLAVSSIYMNDAELNALRKENLNLRETSLRYGVRPDFYVR